MATGSYGVKGYSKLPMFLNLKQNRRVIKLLRNNNNLVISKPDKGAGVVLLDHADYVNKMSLIQNDDTKFKKLGPVETCDHTTSIEAKFQKHLNKRVKSGLLSPEISDSIRPFGSIRPRLYGLLKIHKDGVPFRPILSMVGSAQQKVAIWLSSVLQPVLEPFSCFCIKDFFHFPRLSETSAQLICLCAPLLSLYKRSS